MAIIGRFARLALGICLTLVLSGTAFAQYGGGTAGSSSPSYGSGKAIGIGVGAAAGGAVVLYLALHHAGKVTGCVQATGNGLSLVDDKKKQTYSLVPGSVDLKSGQRVELSGKRSKDAAGAQTFEPKKMVKSLGTCGTQSALNSSHSNSE